MTTINMWELAEIMDPDKKINKYSWAEEHKVVDIQPISYAESRAGNLMLTTCKCERIFISFGM